jgi:hypothetical protein
MTTSKGQKLNERLLIVVIEKSDGGVSNEELARLMGDLSCLEEKDLHKVTRAVKAELTIRGKGKPKSGHIVSPVSSDVPSDSVSSLKSMLNQIFQQLASQQKQITKLSQRFSVNPPSISNTNYSGGYKGKNFDPNYHVKGRAAAQAAGVADQAVGNSQVQFQSQQQGQVQRGSGRGVSPQGQQQQINPGQQQQQTPVIRNIEDIECWQCGQTGHFRNGCPITKLLSSCKE